MLCVKYDQVYDVDCQYIFVVFDDFFFCYVRFEVGVYYYIMLIDSVVGWQGGIVGGDFVFYGVIEGGGECVGEFEMGGIWVLGEGGGCLVVDMLEGCW